MKSLPLDWDWIVANHLPCLLSNRVYPWTWNPKPQRFHAHTCLIMEKEPNRRVLHLVQIPDLSAMNRSPLEALLCIFEKNRFSFHHLFWCFWIGMVDQCRNHSIFFLYWSAKHLKTVVWMVLGLPYYQIPLVSYYMNLASILLWYAFDFNPCFGLDRIGWWQQGQYFSLVFKVPQFAQNFLSFFV